MDKENELWFSVAPTSCGDAPPKLKHKTRKELTALQPKSMKNFTGTTRYARIPPRKWSQYITRRNNCYYAFKGGNERLSHDVAYADDSKFYIDGNTNERGWKILILQLFGLKKNASGCTKL